MPNLGEQLIKKGLSFKGYSEDLSASGVLNITGFVIDGISGLLAADDRTAKPTEPMKADRITQPAQIVVERQVGIVNPPLLFYIHPEDNQFLKRSQEKPAKKAMSLPL